MLRKEENEEDGFAVVGFPNLESQVLHSRGSEASPPRQSRLPRLCLWDLNIMFCKYSRQLLNFGSFVCLRNLSSCRVCKP